MDKPMTKAERYQQFVKELTELSRRYGVAVQSVGGVHIFDDPAKCRKLRYMADETSSDLLLESWRLVGE